MERNLDKETGYHPYVPDTALSGELSSVYCVLDHHQYWLIRNVLDHNSGEAIPDFPQPSASLQPPDIQVSLRSGLRISDFLESVDLALEFGENLVKSVLFWIITVGKFSASDIVSVTYPPVSNQQSDPTSYFPLSQLR